MIGIPGEGGTDSSGFLKAFQDLDPATNASPNYC